jgi:phage I-like protein
MTRIGKDEPGHLRPGIASRAQLAAAAVMFLGDGGDGGSDDDDDVELSETDRTVAKKLGVSEEDFKAANKESNN